MRGAPGDEEPEFYTDDGEWVLPEASVEFGAVADGPWTVPLDRGVGEPQGFDMGPGARWRCPICNNPDREAIDRELAARGVVGRGWTFARSDVLRHVRAHLMPSLVRVGKAMGVLDMEIDMELCAEVPRSTIVPVQEPGEADKVAEFAAVAADPLAVPETRYGKPWTRAQEGREIAAMERESINFYDEMMDIRSKARRVYDEIMDEGDLKFYGTAVSAIRELRGVVLTMGQMSLIARRLGDGEEGRRMSPALAGLIDDIRGDITRMEGEAGVDTSGSLPVDVASSDARRLA